MRTRRFNTKIYGRPPSTLSCRCCSVDDSQAHAAMRSPSARFSRPGGYGRARSDRRKSVHQHTRAKKTIQLMRKWTRPRVLHTVLAAAAFACRTGPTRLQCERRRRRRRDIWQGTKNYKYMHTTHTGTHVRERWRTLHTIGRACTSACNGCSLSACVHSALINIKPYNRIYAMRVVVGWVLALECSNARWLRAHKHEYIKQSCVAGAHQRFHMQTRRRDLANWATAATTTTPTTTATAAAACARFHELSNLASAPACALWIEVAWKIVWCVRSEIARMLVCVASAG